MIDWFVNTGVHILQINNNITSTGSDQWDYFVSLTVNIKIVRSCTAVKKRCKLRNKKFKQENKRSESFFCEKKIICLEFQEISDELNSFSEFVDSNWNIIN